MKPRAQIILVVAVLLGLAAWSAMQRGARSAAAGGNGGACFPLMTALDAKLFAGGTNQTTTTTAAQQVVAYYFHATVRCETCLLIEAQAKAVIEEQFNAERAANRLKFTPVNYELPANAHFLSDYKLPCPSLVLVRQHMGKDDNWKLLGETWTFAHDPVRLNNYLATEVRKFLSGPESQSSPKQVELPTGPDPR